MDLRRCDPITLWRHHPRYVTVWKRFNARVRARFRDEIAQLRSDIKWLTIATLISKVDVRRIEAVLRTLPILCAPFPLLTV